MLLIRAMVTVIAFLALGLDAVADTPIACGETKHASYNYGHMGLVFYSLQAEAGQKIAFLSESGDSNVVIHIKSADQAWQSSAMDGPRGCFNWIAHVSGNHLVVQDISASWGWSVSLSVFCGAPPEDCSEVAVVSTTWTGVKSLFR